MRIVAHVFVVLSFIAFIACQATPEDAKDPRDEKIEILGQLVFKLVPATDKGLKAQAATLELLNQRIAVMEKQLALQTGCDKEAVSPADAEALAEALSKANQLQAEAIEAYKDLSDYLKSFD